MIFLINAHDSIFADTVRRHRTQTTVTLLFSLLYTHYKHLPFDVTAESLNTRVLKTDSVHVGALRVLR